MSIPFQHATPEFKLKRFAMGHPCISMTDNGDLDNTVLNRRTSFLFACRKETTLDEAMTLQELLERYVETISVQGI